MTGWDHLAEIPHAYRALKRRIRSVPNVIIPDVPGKPQIYADDPSFLKMMRLLADDLTSQLPAVIDENGFGGPNGVIDDFYKLRTVSGMVMNPVTIPSVDNNKLCDDLKLATSFLSKRHELIFERLHDTMFGSIGQANLSIRKAASTGFPHVTTDLSTKKALLFDFAENFDVIIKKIEKGQLEDLFYDHQLFFASASGLRLQPDKVERTGDDFKSKDREVNDISYALSGGREGKRFIADKTVVVRGQQVKGHFCMRARAVWGAPFAPNYYLAMFFTLFREVYLNKYAFTWKHRTAAEISDKLANYSFIVGVDVKQFDQSVRGWLLDFFVDKFDRKLDQRVQMLLKTILRMPYFQTDPRVNVDEPEGLQFGDPFDLKTFSMNVGLPSGVSPNPDIGKFICTGTYLCLLDDYFHDVLEKGVDTILRGDHPQYGLLNAGDDCVLMTNDTGFKSFVDNFTKDKPEYYLRVEPEIGVSFLGNVIHRDHRNNLKVSPNINSFVVNWLVPENGITSPSRRDYHHLGWLDRKEHFFKAPEYETVFGIWEKHYHDQFKENLNAREDWYSENSKLKAPSNLTSIDRQVLIDPSKLQYKFSSEDVSSFVLDQIVASVEFELFYPLIKHLILV